MPWRHPGAADMDVRELSRCGRCGRRLKNIREEYRHNSGPCDQDNVLARRAKREAERRDGVPSPSRKRGRKLMMKRKAA
jgi:hypothetical protein